MKSPLSNKLLGMYVSVVFGTEHLWLGLDLVAEIVAAWTEEGKVRVAVIDKHGHEVEFFLEHVKVFKDLASAIEYVGAYQSLMKSREEILKSDVDVAQRQESWYSQVLHIESQLKAL